MKSSVNVITQPIQKWETGRSAVSSADSNTDISTPTNALHLYGGASGIIVSPVFNGASDSCTVHVIGYPSTSNDRYTSWSYDSGGGCVLAELSFSAGSFNPATGDYTDTAQTVDLYGFRSFEFIVNTLSGTLDYLYYAGIK